MAENNKPSYQGYQSLDDDKPPPYSAEPLYPQQLPTGFEPIAPPPPPPKYGDPPIVNQPGYYGATAIHIPVQQHVIILGECPICRIGRIEDYYSCFGLFCAVFCFPLGIIPCLLLRDKICTNCGAHIN